MSSILCIMLRFLDPVPQFHGRGDDGNPEWPPSPLRLFQALVAASATRWRENQFRESARPALQWLETIAPSVVVPEVPGGSFGYRMYVPNNSGDLMTAAWARGDTETSMAKFRVEKDVRPTHLRGEAVYYLFPLLDGNCPFFEVLQAAARSVTHFGWGIDMVAGNAEILTESQAAGLPGEVWRPASDHSGTALRVPKEGTLDALMEKHQEFLGRLSDRGFKPVPPLSVFRVLYLRRATDPPRRQYAAFSLLKLDGSGFRPFDTTARLKAVAGMMRHAAKATAKASGWKDEAIDSLILGHAERPGEPHKPVSGPRLAYVPLPSIQFRGKGDVVTDIRRAILMQVGGGSTDMFHQLMRLLGGALLIPKPPSTESPGAEDFSSTIEWDQPELKDSHGPIAMLARLPNSDRQVERYTRTATTWATVTPMILPGYDDRKHHRRRLKEGGIESEEQKRLLDKLDARTEQLIRSAIVHAGYSEELARFAHVEWRGSGFWPGVELASRYAVPKKLEKFPRLHVRITWRDVGGNEIGLPGPICLGGGRYFGLGLFAAR